MKYYAIKVGRKTGIFTDWNECQPLVKGFKGALYKSFKNEEDAKAYLNDDTTSNDMPKQQKNIIIDPSEYTFGAYAFVDGSFNQKTNTYGYGGFLCIPNKEEIILQGCGDDVEFAKSRNIAGEIDGAISAIATAIHHRVTDLTIFHDYEGIAKWITGEYKANSRIAKAYLEFIQQANNHIRLHFVHVKAHTGIKGNERADKLAKQAVGL